MDVCVYEKFSPLLIVWIKVLIRSILDKNIKIMSLGFLC